MFLIDQGSAMRGSYDYSFQVRPLLTYPALCMLVIQVLLEKKKRHFLKQLMIVKLIGLYILTINYKNILLKHLKIEEKCNEENKILLGPSYRVKHF